MRGESLIAELERRFVTARDSVVLAGESLELLRPRTPEDLIDEEDFERDERLPYWADLWPSAMVLADVVARERGGGRALLELGCGLGLVTIAALRAGYEVLATDYYEDSLRFTRANAHLALGRAPATKLVNWRELPRDLGRFERVVGSDVLYEREYGALVASVLDRTLARRGRATIADPGRVAAESFLTACAAAGLEVRTESRAFSVGKIRQDIRLHDVTRR